MISLHLEVNPWNCVIDVSVQSREFSRVPGRCTSILAKSLFDLGMAFAFTLDVGGRLGVQAWIWGFQGLGRSWRDFA